MIIQNTNNYSLFSFLDNNRIIKKSHVSMLIKAIEKLDLTKFNPIKVDSDFHIIDGQHRFEACKELGLPIYYIVVRDVDAEQAMMIDNQTSKKWDMMDWLRYRANKNGGCYQLLLSFIEETGTTISNAMVIYPNIQINSSTLRMGTTNFGQNPKAYEIVDFLQSEEIRQLSFRNTRPFTLAVRTAFDEYNKRQMEKLKRKALLIPQCANYKQYITVFHNIIKR